MWYLLKQRQIEGVGFSAADFRFRFFVQFVRFSGFRFLYNLCVFWKDNFRGHPSSVTSLSLTNSSWMWLHHANMGIRGRLPLDLQKVLDSVADRTPGTPESDKKLKALLETGTA